MIISHRTQREYKRPLVRGAFENEIRRVSKLHDTLDLSISGISEMYKTLFDELIGKIQTGYNELIARDTAANKLADCIELAKLNPYARAVIEPNPDASPLELYFFDENCVMHEVTTDMKFDMVPLISISYTDGVLTEVYSLSKHLYPRCDMPLYFFSYTRNGILEVSKTN
mgnify:FL=1